MNPWLDLHEEYLEVYGEGLPIVYWQNDRLYTNVYGYVDMVYHGYANQGEIICKFSSLGQEKTIIDVTAPESGWILFFVKSLTCLPAGEFKGRYVSEDSLIYNDYHPVI